MEREEILQRIKKIGAELEIDQLQIIKQKILERQYHLHKSERNRILHWLIKKARKRLILEVNLLLEPILENQKEINLRFLKEIELIKEALVKQEPALSDPKDEAKISQPPAEDKE